MKTSKGITLIALIITIIIMLILVAVTIDVAIDGKLFDTAKEAVDKTNNKVGQTQDRIDELMNELNEINDDNPNPNETEHNWIRNSDNIKCSNCNREFVIGDYVDYTPDTSINSITILGTESGAVNSNGETLDQVITKDENTYWRVMGVEDSDNNGTNETLLIKMATPTTQTLIVRGEEAYNNGPDIFNRVCKELYSNSKYGEARSININDVNNTFNYIPTGAQYLASTVYYPRINTNAIEIQNFNTKLKDLQIQLSSSDMEKYGEYELTGYSYDIDGTTITNPVTGFITNTTENAIKSDRSHVVL